MPSTIDLYNPTIVCAVYFSLAEVQRALEADQEFTRAVPLIGPQSDQERRAEILKWPTICELARVAQIILGASQSFFYPQKSSLFWDRPLSLSNVQKWLKATLAYLKKMFNPQGLMVDYRPPPENEAASSSPPLIHVWLDGRNVSRLNVPRQVDYWPRLMASYSAALAPLGFRPPPKLGKPTEEAIARYYRATRDYTEPQIPQEKELAEYVTLPASIPASSAAANWPAYCSQTLELTNKRANALFGEWAYRNKALEVEAERFKAESYALEVDVRKLEKRAKTYQSDYVDLEGIWPAEVLRVLYQAVEVNALGEPLAADSPLTVRRYFRTPTGRIVATRFNSWNDLASGQSGQGALNLIMALSGYDLDEASVFLLGAYSGEEVTKCLAARLAVTTDEAALAALETPFELPLTSEATWPKAREFLVSEYGLPTDLLEAAHQDRRILSSSLGAIIFNGDEDSGLSFMFPKANGGKLPYIESALATNWPWTLKGPEEPVYLTDHPLEALSLKALFPLNPVMAIGQFIPLSNVVESLNGQSSVIAARKGRRGRALIRRLAPLKLAALKPIQPINSETWNEVYRLSQSSANPVRTLFKKCRSYLLSSRP